MVSWGVSLFIRMFTRRDLVRISRFLRVASSDCDRTWSEWMRCVSQLSINLLALSIISFENAMTAKSSAKARIVFHGMPLSISVCNKSSRKMLNRNDEIVDP